MRTRARGHQLQVINRRLWTGKRKNMPTRMPLGATTALMIPAMAPKPGPRGLGVGLALVLELGGEAEVGDSVPTLAMR